MTDIKIYGLPRSGTNFLEFMVSKNFHAKVVITEHGWKHDFFEKNVPCKKVFLTKHPLSWLVSFYEFAIQRPYVYKISQTASFSEFLRSEYHWSSDTFGPGSPYRIHRCLNPMLHWNLMHEHWLTDAAHVQYEDLISDKVALRNLAIQLEVQVNKNWRWPTKQVKPGEGRFAKTAPDADENGFDRIRYYQNKEYLQRYTPDDLEFVQSNYDDDLMQKLRY